MRTLELTVAAFVCGCLLMFAFIEGRRYEREADHKYWERVIGDTCNDCERIGYKDGYKKGQQEALREQDDNNRR